MELTLLLILHVLESRTGAVGSANSVESKWLFLLGSKGCGNIVTEWSWPRRWTWTQFGSGKQSKLKSGVRMFELGLV